MINQFEKMIGVTCTSVSGEVGKEEMVFFVAEEPRFRFWHRQDCCEGVYIDDVIGDLSDLVGSPIIVAEEVSSEDAPAPNESASSYTWTFYRFATVKGVVTVKWLGTSNGYYSEGVSYDDLHSPSM